MCFSRLKWLSECEQIQLFIIFEDNRNGYGATRQTRCQLNQSVAIHLFLSISPSFVRNRIRLHAIVRVSVSARQTIAAVVVNVSEYLFHHKQNYPRRTQVDKY